MTKNEFWTHAFTAQGLDEAAVKENAMHRGAALAARRAEGTRAPHARRPLTALAAAAAVCLFAVGAGAAGGLFKTPPEAAAIIAPQDLTAFAEDDNYRTLVDIYSAPDVLTVNEVQADAGYTVTLLAVANEPAADGDTAHTHILYTVACSDGAPLTDAELLREVRAEVLVQGYGTAAPYSASSGTWRVQDGVGYMDCRLPDLYSFADRALYLAVRQGWGFASELGYHADADGRITTVEDYEHLNLLFTLPIGPEHADAAAAARAEESWQYTPTAGEQAALAAAIEEAKARAEQDAAAAAADTGRPLPEPNSAEDTVQNNLGTPASTKAALGAYAGFTRAALRAAGETLFSKTCELTLLPGQPEPCYYYESPYNSRIFDTRELNGAPWAVVGTAYEDGAVNEITILSDNGDGTVTVEIIALPPLDA